MWGFSGDISCLRLLHFITLFIHNRAKDYAEAAASVPFKSFVSDIVWTSEVAKGKLHSILRLEVSQLSKPRVSDFGTTI